MANENIDTITDKEEPSLSEELAQTLTHATTDVVENSRSISMKLKDEYGSRNEVKRQIKKLLRRTEIMSLGIKDSAPGPMLDKFQGFIYEQSGAMNQAYEIILDNDMLARMLERYGDNLQEMMASLGLLSPEAEEQLRLLSEDISIDNED
jgi:hypothetical protein